MFTLEFIEFIKTYLDKNNQSYSNIDLKIIFKRLFLIDNTKIVRYKIYLFIYKDSDPIVLNENENTELWCFLNTISKDISNLFYTKRDIHENNFILYPFKENEKLIYLINES